MKVSIILPVYNTEKFLRKCLDSLVSQTYKDFEIIIINDGSTDNSQKIIDEYQKKYSNVVAYLKENGGLSSARNEGLKYARGEYIMFVDSDDYVAINILEELMNNISDNDICLCGMKKVINGREERFDNYFNFKNGQINLMLSPPGAVAKLYRKDLLKNNLFTEKIYYEDLAFTPVLATQVKKVKYVDKALYYYLIHDNSIMQKVVFNQKLDDIFTVINHLESKLINYPLELEYLNIDHLLYSASLRFLRYKEGKERLIRINNIMKKYPNWKKNPYYKLKSKKFKIVCFLSYHKCYFLLKIIDKLKGQR